ncbi:MAG: hypothetical protein CMF39_01320, partial [Legionellaceae bacterium]|nr:hypothetical protein [Legionellaceae bacterium]
MPVGSSGNRIVKHFSPAMPSSRPLRSKIIQRFDPTCVRPCRCSSSLLLTLPGSHRRGWSPSITKEYDIMPAIGFVTHNPENDTFTGEIKTISIRCPIRFEPRRNKTNDRQPDYSVY